MARRKPRIRPVFYGTRGACRFRMQSDSMTLLPASIYSCNAKMSEGEVSARKRLRTIRNVSSHPSRGLPETLRNVHQRLRAANRQWCSYWFSFCGRFQYSKPNWMTMPYRIVLFQSVDNRSNNLNMSRFIQTVIPKSAKPIWWPDQGRTQLVANEVCLLTSGQTAFLGNRLSWLSRYYFSRKIFRLHVF